MMYFSGTTGIIIVQVNWKFGNFGDNVGFAQLWKSECEKMSDNDNDALIASGTIIISSVLKVREF